MKYIIIILLVLTSCTTKEMSIYSFSQRHMGVDFRIDVYAETHSHAKRSVELAFARIKEIDECMSDYIVDSELWRLSESSGKNIPFKVSDDMWEVLTFSAQMNELTDGAFDITVGPYVLLWRQSRITKIFPLEKSLQRAKASVGMDKVKFDPKNKTVTLLAPNMRLDLGGIAKGYALDEACKVLKNNGIKYAMIDGGGGILTTENRDGFWQIYISNKTQEEGTYINFDKGSIATSGDYFQHAIINGKKYSHIVDPKTGIGVTDSYQASVIAKDGKTADALATALTIMGVEKGLKLIEKLDEFEALMIKFENDKKHSFETSDFPKIFYKNNMELK